MTTHTYANRVHALEIVLAAAIDAANAEDSRDTACLCGRLIQVCKWPCTHLNLQPEAATLTVSLSWTLPAPPTGSTAGLAEVAEDMVAAWEMLGEDAGFFLI